MRAFQFHEVFKPTIWGGDLIAQIKSRLDLPMKIGESWEISGLKEGKTLVKSGEDEGKDLVQLIQKYGAKLLGRQNYERYGINFPLLVKIIHANEDLSIQVHPNDIMAKKMGHPFGKNEAWYVIGTEKKSYITAGFKYPFSKDAYYKALADNNLNSFITKHESHVGDFYYIPSGRIHAIGAGNLLIEVQQTSNDTFRVYDYNRVDGNGRHRKLHVEEAAVALNFNDVNVAPIAYKSKINTPVKLIESPNFTMRLNKIVSHTILQYDKLDSFVIYTIFKGKAIIEVQNNDSESYTLSLESGESILFPAIISNIKITPTVSFEFIEAYINA